MKTLFIACLVLLASTCFAQPFMCMSYDGVPWDVEGTNLDPEIAVPFDLHLVVGATGLAFIGGYEVRIDIDVPTVFILSVDGPNGWTNFGDNDNHLCGFQTPLPMTAADQAVVATFTLLYPENDTAYIYAGPSDPSSVDDAGPAIVNGVDLDEVIACQIPYAGGGFGLVATIYGPGVYEPFAVEGRSWSGVKQLFR